MLNTLHTLINLILATVLWDQYTSYKWRNRSMGGLNDFSQTHKASNGRAGIWTLDYSISKALTGFHLQVLRAERNVEEQVTDFLVILPCLEQNFFGILALKCTHLPVQACPAHTYTSTHTHTHAHAHTHSETFPPEDKLHEGREICSAMSYLGALEPSLAHRSC